MKYFPTTHWSVVLNAGETSSEHSAEALTELCQTYWYPIYAFSRSLGDSKEDAEDLTQAFFLHVLRTRLTAKAHPTFGKFRAFLITSFRNFRSVHRRRGKALKRGGGTEFVSFEQLAAEERYVHEPKQGLNVERRYDRNWAITVVEQAQRRLADEYTKAGQTAYFARLTAFLPESDEPSGYDTVAQEFGKSVAAIKMEVARMRKRYFELLLGTVSHTVANASEAIEELRYLLGLLAA